MKELTTINYLGEGMTLSPAEKVAKRRAQFKEKDEFKAYLQTKENSETRAKVLAKRAKRHNPPSALADIKPIEEEEEVLDSPPKPKLYTLDMTKDELYDVGKENDLPVTRRMSKDELMEVLDGREV